jgi:hypothetical protein
MKDAAKFLRMLTGAFPPKKGAHALVLADNGSLMIALRYEDHFHNFTFDETELSVAPEALVETLIGMVPEAERRYRESLTHARGTCDPEPKEETP